MQTLKKTTYSDYFSIVNPQYIEWDFYKSYLDKEPPFGEIGLLVAVRTYNRFIEELGRREKWCETILRNIEYSLSLDVVSSLTSKKEEAKKLFDMMFNLRGFPSGRSLWTAGTKQTLKDGSSGWNCTFKAINCLSAFSEIFYWLLIGAGTGFSVEDKYVSQLPKLNSNVTITHKVYDPVPASMREEVTELTGDYGYLYLTKEDLISNDFDFYNKLTKVNSAKVTIKVGDSKESWCNSLRAYLHLLTLPLVKIIEFVYDNVRPEGERIKTFGGRASGPKALVDLFNNIDKIIKRCKGIIDSVAALDINNCIGLNVVSGGVRRTAEIGLGSVEDIAFIEAKLNLYTDPNKEEYRAIRSMSNNSVLLYKNPGLDKIKEIMESIKSNGEPGFWIIGNSQKLAESPVAGTNPCAEAALDNDQSCNLTTINQVSYVYWNESTQQYEYDWELAKQDIELITRIGSRQTCATQWHPIWHSTQKRDRLLGVSMTGVQDAFDLLNWTTEQKQYLYQWTKAVSIAEANSYHDFMKVNRSTRVTLMKPEGTISQLPTVSSGIHRAYSPYYYRRIRFSKTDPLAKALLEVGLQAVPENNQGNDLFADKCTTWVFTFPVKTNTTIKAIDEDAISQLESYKLAQVNYADRGHNISATITLNYDEYDKAANWINDNWDDIIGVSFLPRFDPVEGGSAAYPLMPYEPTDKEGYKKLKASIPYFKEDELLSLLTKYESSYEEKELNEECTTGCPIR